MLVEVLERGEVPTNRVSVEEQDVWSAFLAVTGPEVLHKFYAVVVKNVLRHAAIGSNTDGKAMRVDLLLSPWVRRLGLLNRPGSAQGLRFRRPY